MLELTRNVVPDRPVTPPSNSFKVSTNVATSDRAGVFGNRASGSDGDECALNVHGAVKGSITIDHDQ